jgi:hypothetical protein
MRLHAGAQHGVFSHQPLRLNLTAHLAIGGVEAQAPMPGQSALVAAQFDVGAGWLEGFITLDASHFDASSGWTPVTESIFRYGFRQW